MTEIEKRNPELNVLFDYVTVTFPVTERELTYRDELGKSIKSLFVNEHFIYFAKLLGINPHEQDFTDSGKIQHYDQMITYHEHIVFKYNGPLNKMEMNTHSFELKGEGCREAERLGINWYALFAYIHESGLSVSTLHLAGDIFTEKYFGIQQLLNKSLKKEYISFSKKFNYIQSFTSEDKAGTSLYYGRRDDNQVNIYDKKNERYYKGYDVDTNTWIRIEIRLKSNKSWDFIRLYVLKGEDSLPELYVQILSSMLTFKIKTKDKNKNRWPTWRPWERFLNGSEKVKLVNQAKLESTIATKKNWLRDSAGKAMLEYFSAIDPEERTEFFHDIIETKLKKIDMKSLERINQHRKSIGLETFPNLSIYRDYVKKNLMKGIDL